LKAQNSGHLFCVSRSMSLPHGDSEPRIDLTSGIRSINPLPGEAYSCTVIKVVEGDWAPDIVAITG
jgi:hypothetical protein